MRRVLDEPSPAVLDETDSHRKANAAFTLARLGRGELVWPLLRQAPDPGLRTQLVHRFHHVTSPASLIEALRAARQASVRQALLLALGGYPEDRLTGPDRTTILAECRRLFETDPDAGVHSGAEWLLRKWGQAADLDRLQKDLAGAPPRGNWYVHPQGVTMMIVRGPMAAALGSPRSEPLRDEVEIRHDRLIDRSFAISTHEVTVELFRRFDPTYAFPKDVCPTDDASACRISWYDGVRLCRWLTSTAGLPESQQCYPETIGPDMILPDDFWERTGYRLPTDAEWEYTCRAGTITSRFFGDDDSVLGDYAWFASNADEHLWPVGLLKPNPWGLFDVYGNALEWCQNVPLKLDPAQTINPLRDDRFQAGKENERVLRGGGYQNTPRHLRSAKIFRMPPDAKLSFLGLRVARTIK
jgi:formylglycine-generating enzyme required for sulfatase activity